MDEEIVKVAAACRDRAYAPYSGFKVGAAVQSLKGNKREVLLADLLPDAFSAELKRE